MTSGIDVLRNAVGHHSSLLVGRDILQEWGKRRCSFECYYAMNKFHIWFDGIQIMITRSLPTSMQDVGLGLVT